MDIFTLAALLVINFTISWLNAWVVGVGWVESKFVGAWPRFMAWFGAVTSACGFTWCLLAVDGSLANLVSKQLGHPIPERFLHGFYSLGYLVIILPIMGSGLGLTMDFWAYLWRRRTFGGSGVTAWDSFAQVSTMMNSLFAVPQAFSGVVDTLTDRNVDDDDNNLCRLYILLLIAVFALGGVLLTRQIVLSTASKHFIGLRSSLLRARLRSQPRRLTQYRSATLRRATGSRYLLTAKERRPSYAILPFAVQCP